MKRACPSAARFPFRNAARPVEERIRDLLGRLTLEEKVGQMMHEAPAIARLGLPAYNWWNEALHGVARAGRATVFPQAIGLAATFDEALLERVGSAIGDEARAKHHAAVANGFHAQYLGLTFWSPNINIFRDPRWGRGHETYGEDPYLTGRIGCGFIRGLQGNHPRYLKVAACAKHYAVHSGPETMRHGFDAKVSLKDLHETYLEAFRVCVQEARVEAIMGAYNRTNGEPCCASPTLLRQVLREQWGFAGHVLSDCGAVEDIHANHHYTDSPAASAAAAVKTGCDLNCGCTYAHLLEAVRQGLTTEAELDVALTRLLRTRFRLGQFDPPAKVPYALIKPSVVTCEAHRALAREAAGKAIVLLKNNGVLPLPANLNSILVTGPTATNLEVLWGNYNGYSPRLVTPLEGIVAKAGPGTSVMYAPGCPLTGASQAGFGLATWLAQQSDVVIAVMGLAPCLEGEEGDAAESDAGGDRVKLDLPGIQEEFLKKLKATGKKVVLVLTGGSAIAVNWAQENLDAVVMLWYPGEEGGNALGDVLFGDVNPSGRLPVTFYRGLDQVPPFTDYAMAGRTYRYFTGDPLYPFGFGLSYTRFAYAQPKLSARVVKPGQSVKLSVEVHNTGAVAGDEVVQLYLTDCEASVPVPRCRLAGLQRVSLRPKRSRTVRFIITPAMLELVDNDGQRRLEPGRFQVTVGGCSPGSRAAALGASAPAIAEFEVRS